MAPNDSQGGSKGIKKIYDFGILGSNSTVRDVENSEIDGVSCPSCNFTIEQRKHRQSPIDIDVKNVKFQEFRPLSFIGHEKLSISNGTLKAKNTGGTLRLMADPGIGMLGGGPLNVMYEFVEMHFHWGGNAGMEREGSEHKIDGKSYPLEVHMVHKNIHDNNIDDACMHENGLCVLAFICEVVDDETPFTGLDMLADIAEENLTEANSVFDQAKYQEVARGGRKMDINIANFLPFHIEEYFTYRGSLTTGGCEEAVNWVLFKTPMAIKKNHLKAFHMLLNPEKEPIRNNYRETKPANNRPVYYHGEDLLARNVINMGKLFGPRSVDPAPVVGGKKVGCCDKSKMKQSVIHHN